MNPDRWIAAIACVLVLGAGWLIAGGSPIVGSWDCVSTTPTGGEMRWTLVVREQDGKLAGTATSAQGSDMPLIEPRLEGDVFSFKVVLDSESYDVQLKLRGAKLDGSWKGGGETGSVRGTKKV